MTIDKLKVRCRNCGRDTFHARNEIGVDCNVAIYVCEYCDTETAYHYDRENLKILPVTLGR